MNGRRRPVSGLVGLLVLAWAPLAAGDPQTGASAPPGVEVRTWVDRTAMWVGDRVVYTVEVRCPPGTDILDEDVSTEKLRLDGLEVVATESDRVASNEDVTLRRVRYTLTSYAADRPTLRIAPSTLRYVIRRPGQRLEDAAPGGEVQVPGAVVALRSVLPDAAAGLALRDGREPAARPLAYRLAQPAGLGLVLVSVVPALVWMASRLRRWWERPARKAARLARREEQSSLESVLALDIHTVDGRRAAYDGIEMLVRRHLRDSCGIESGGLTSAELADALTARRSGVPPEALRSLIAQCERARYAPPRMQPTAEECGKAIDQAAALISTR